MAKRRKVLVSLYNKSGLEQLAEIFNTHQDEVYSTGGTAKALRELGVEVKDVSALTQFPEVMDGRVKTLHPNIHMGLLARKDHEGDAQTLKEFGVSVFDIVVGNLYDFEAGIAKGLAFHEQIELVDVGGPSFLRAAAKSFDRINVMCDPADYELLKTETTLEQRKYLAAKVFKHTSYYDSQIAAWLSEGTDFFADQEWALGAHKVSELRYGENPSQKASWYKTDIKGLHNARVLQGKELSYNNILDLQSAIDALKEFEKPTVVSLKHTNPCGVSQSEDLTQALQESLAADPMSVFGGIIALNQTVDKDQAELLAGIFVECIVAPQFSDEAQKVFAKKKNLRLLEWPEMMEFKKTRPMSRSVMGGLLVQTPDLVGVDEKTWVVHGETPSVAILDSLKFAWRVCAHLKSNAIAVCSGTKTVGLGMGQVSRIDAMEQAFMRAKKFHPEAKDLVLASDAFFPFSDSIELAAQNNVKWIIQPGGSIKDAEVISKARELSVNMIFTGVRHFKH
ncbi:MAG: bifunctional phosphoribosylaminoimidazolecarboxamide formyltransferase/IMP cyclohydrolase [Bdellovibrionaceae bacterium]|nr:bifunctional phosphoribosylaminoimidazolecarboxamide formyltransferase/IMP cyclohydrolase [Pseudobdellovibrionaceae bacterium]